MRDFLRKEIPALLLVLAPFAALPFVWGEAPAQLPLQWSLTGEVNHYGSKAEGLLAAPLVNLGVYALVLFLPKIDPKRVSAWDQKPLPAVRFFTALLVTTVHFVSLTAAMSGAAFDAARLSMLAAVLFFLGLGNALGALAPNYFVGIRTPWTLEDPQVWRETHHAAGRLWVATSALLLLAWFVVAPARFGALFLAGVLLMVGVPIAHSFYLWRTRSANARG